MLIVFLILTIVLLLVCLTFISFHAFRWARIIFIMEDKYSEAINVHERTLETFGKIINSPLFFDSPSTRQIVMEILEDVKVCKMATQKIIYTLTEHSKRKYFIEKEE